MLRVEKVQRFDKNTSAKTIRKFLTGELISYLNPNTRAIFKIKLSVGKNEQITHIYKFSSEMIDQSFAQTLDCSFGQPFELAIFEFVEIYPGPYTCQYSLLPWVLN